MDAEIIKDFLISLGFDIDDAGMEKFDGVVVGATASVSKMGAAVEAAADTLLLFTTKIASGLDTLYGASQRTVATVAGINAMSYAALQAGSSAETARGSLESLSRFMHNNLGAESFLNRLGVQTREASGNMRDMSAVFTGVGQQLSNMSDYRANQYAQMLGIDENTLIAMRRGLSGFSAEYSAVAKTLGFNADQAALDSNRFIASLRGFDTMADRARDKIGSNLADGLTGSMDDLYKQILDNGSKIESALMRIITGSVGASDAITRVLWRIGAAVNDITIELKKLDPVTKQLVALFGGLLTVWRLLNSALLASPISMLVSFSGALLLLYDDYKMWQEGSKSLINGDNWKTEIDAALTAINELKDSIKNVGKEITHLLNIDLKNGSLKSDIENLTKPFGEFGKMVSMSSDLINALKEGNWSDVSQVGKVLLNQDSDQPDARLAVTDALPIVTNARQTVTNTRQTVTNSTNTSVDWVKDKFGFDLQSVGRWERGENDERVQSARIPQATAEGTKLLDLLKPTLSRLDGLYQLPAVLLKSVATAGSSGDPNIVSDAGVPEHFPMIPRTGKDWRLRDNDVFDLVTSSQATKYLAQLMKINGSNLEKTLASYKWDLGNVQKYGMALAPQEMRNDLSKVPTNTLGNTLNQKTNIYVYGASDSNATANEIEKRQEIVNSRANQQMNRGPG